MFHKPTDHSLRKYKNKKKLFQQTQQKREKTFFNKLNTSFVSDNELFWKSVKPFFPNKGSHRGSI